MSLMKRTTSVTVHSSGLLSRTSFSSSSDGASCPWGRREHSHPSLAHTGPLTLASGRSGRLQTLGREGGPVGLGEVIVEGSVMGWVSHGLMLKTMVFIWSSGLC